MIALAAPRFKWPRLANLAWPGLDLAYVLCEQRMMMMMMMLNGLAHGTGWDVDVDMAHANAGHKREFKSHLYNRMLRVVFFLAIWLLFIFGYFLLRMGCKCNRVMHSARFLFLLGFGFSFEGRYTAGQWVCG